MSETITIEFKDGTSESFAHKGRAGGSYTISIKYEGAFAIVEDEWHKRIAFPAADIKRVTTTERGGW